MVVIAIAATASIIGVLALIALWACLFYKFYIKRKRKLQRDEENSGRHLQNSNSQPPATTKASKVFSANQAFNLAYDDSLEQETMENNLKPASTNGSIPYGNYSNTNGNSGHVYHEQYSTDSGTSISEVMDTYGHNSTGGMSRYSGSDSEGNRSVRFAEALPTLRGDQPPVDGREKIPKTKMGFWIKPPPAPRGRKPLPFQYVGNKNPAYNKASGRRVSSKDVVAVAVKVPQKKGKRSSRGIQQLQPSDVVVSEPMQFDDMQPQAKSRKTKTPDSSYASQNNSFPLLENVRTAGRPPGGNKPVRQRSILKKPKSDQQRQSGSSIQSGSSMSSAEHSMTSQSGTDNSETEAGIVPHTVQRRSKRRRPKSIRNVGNTNNSETEIPVYGNPPRSRVQGETYKPIKTDSTPPIAQSSPQSPRVIGPNTPNGSFVHQGQQSFNASTNSELRPKMPYEYYPPKSPGDRVLDDDMEPLPYAKPKMRSKEFVNPYEDAANKKGNRSSSEIDSNYFSGNSPMINFNPGDAAPTEAAMQSRQKRRRKKSTKRGTRPNMAQNSSTETNTTPTVNGHTKYDNIAFVDDDDSTDIYHMNSNKAQNRNPRPGRAMPVQGHHGSETEI